MAPFIAQLQYLMLFTLVHETRFASSQELRCDKAAASDDVIVADTCTADLVGGDTSTMRFVEMMRLEYEHYPEECRPGKDVCDEIWSWGSGRRGDIKWPSTLIGSRRAVRCKYAYTEAIYVSRDCVADVNSTSETWAVWGEWNDSYIEALCPEPPFTIATQTLYDSLANVTSVAVSGLCESVIQSMVNLISIRTRYPLDPLFDTDHEQLMTVSVRWMAGCHVSQRAANSSWRLLEANTLLTVTDRVLFDSASSYRWTSDSYAAYIESLMRVLQSSTTAAAAAAASVDKSEKIQYYGNTFSVLAVSTGSSNTSMTSYAADQQHRIESPSNSLGVVLVNASRSLMHSIQMILISNAHFISANLERWQQPTKKRSSQGNDTIKQNVESDASHMKSWTNTLTSRPITDLFGNGIGTLIWPSIVASVVVMNCSGGSSIYTGQKETGERELGMTVIFKHPSFVKLRINDVVCASKPFVGNSNTSINDWYGDNCQVQFFMNDTIGCRCIQTSGYFTVFTIVGEDLDSIDTAKARGIPRTRPDLSSFMGFPYNYELYISGQVLRAVSTVCLAATIATYVVCTKIRRGTPGRILINLCLSLIALNIVLYIAEQFGASKLGCRISNIFRYYFIIVSLLWNGIEAHNMYRMLVRVFNSSSQSHFVRRAAVVSWVLPAAAVSITLAVHYKVFDGTFHDCSFRCSLKVNTLYYGWLLPMSVIILHNVIVFLMVVRVLCQRKHPGSVQKSPENDHNSLRSHWTRLCGACAMLVLLGVPWIFSAFAVIDSSNSSPLQMLEGIFNVVFIVGVNLQGIFIFGFHCARLQAVRESWKTSIVSRLSSNSWSTANTSSTASRPASTTGHARAAATEVQSKDTTKTETKL